MARLKAPTTIGGVPINPVSPAMNQALVWNGTEFVPMDQAGSVGVYSQPVGSMQMFGAATPPTNWLLCDGASLLRTDHVELFAAIGVGWGSVDGTHFNVPNLSQRFPVGMGSGEYDLADIGGEEKHALVTAELAAHGHGVGTLAIADHNHADTFAIVAAADHDHTLSSQTVTVGAHGHQGNAGSIAKSASTSGGFSSATGTGAQGGHGHTLNGSVSNRALSITGSAANAGSGTAHENRPPFIAVPFIIYRGVL